MAELTLSVRVKPGAGRARVGGAYGDPPALVVAVHAPPVDGRANAAVVEAVAAALGVRRGDVSVVTGQTARTKTLRITVPDADVTAVQAGIAALLLA